MNFNSFKQIMTTKLTQVSFNEDDNQNKIILGAIIYGTLLKITAMNKSFTGKESVLINSYFTTYKSTVSELPKYISYRYITSYIRKENIMNFFSITEKQAIKIYEYYSNKEKIEYFSPAGYNSKMYGILEDIDNKLLPHLHWDIMVPIYKYYNSKNSITSHDINIHDALLSEKPGKKILFSIANIPDSTIYTDIQNDKIGIKKYLYSTTLNETGVILTLK